ncbi:MAG: hypothetical protein WBP22_01130 [Candidatus Saccharimonas sp.]
MTSSTFGQQATIQVAFEFIDERGKPKQKTCTWQLDSIAQQALNLVRLDHASDFNRVIGVLEQALRRGIIHASLALLILAVASTDSEFDTVLDRIEREVGVARNLNSVVDSDTQEIDPFSAPSPFSTSF